MYLLRNRAILTPSAPPIISDSLLFHFDAGDSSSYPGSGTTWINLANTSRNATLQNGAIYNSEAGGNIFLDGVNDWISVNTTSAANSSATYEFWIKYRAGNSYFWVVDNFDNPENRLSFDTTGRVIAQIYDAGAYRFNVTSSASVSGWGHIVLTVTNGAQRLYINSVLDKSGSGYYDGGGVYEHSLGTYNRPATGYGGYADVNYGVYRMYSRVLSAAEVTNNFESQRRRFGL